MSSKFGGVLAAAKEPSKAKTSKAENQKTSTPDVNLSIKVPKSHRLHWLIAAKTEGTSLTAVIKEALTERFGVPGGQQ